MRALGVGGLVFEALSIWDSGEGIVLGRDH